MSTSHPLYTQSFYYKLLIILILLLPRHGIIGCPFSHIFGLCDRLPLTLSISIKIMAIQEILFCIEIRFYNYLYLFQFYAYGIIIQSKIQAWFLSKHFPSLNTLLSHANFLFLFLSKYPFSLTSLYVDIFVVMYLSCVLYK